MPSAQVSNAAPPTGPSRPWRPRAKARAEAVDLLVTLDRSSTTDAPRTCARNGGRTGQGWSPGGSRRWRGGAARRRRRGWGSARRRDRRQVKTLIRALLAGDIPTFRGLGASPPLGYTCKLARECFLVISVPDPSRRRGRWSMLAESTGDRGWPTIERVRDHGTGHRSVSG